jgi:hypothetical protein
MIHWCESHAACSRQGRVLETCFHCGFAKARLTSPITRHVQILPHPIQANRSPFNTFETIRKDHNCHGRSLEHLIRPPKPVRDSNIIFADRTPLPGATSMLADSHIQAGRGLSGIPAGRSQHIPANERTSQQDTKRVDGRRNS